MASEQAFWKAFCAAVGRDDLFERWPGSRVADHAPGNVELQDELRTIFAGKTAVEWIAFGDEFNVPIAPVNTPTTLQDDPQFAARLGWIDRAELGADQLPAPIKVVDGTLPPLRKAPTPGEQTDEILAEVLGWDSGRIAEARAEGTVG